MPTQVSGYAPWPRPRRCAALPAVAALARHDDAGEVLDVHLVHDAGARRDDAESAERALAPAQELEALTVALELELHVLLEGVGAAEEVGDHGVVDDQLGGDEGVDLRRVAAELLHGFPHGGEVDHGRDAGQVLQDHPGRGELDLGIGLLLRVPVRQRFDVGGRYVDAVLVAEQVLQQDLQAVREVLCTGDRVQPVDLIRRAARLDRRASAEAVRSHRYEPPRPFVLAATVSRYQATLQDRLAAGRGRRGRGRGRSAADGSLSVPPLAEGFKCRFTRAREVGA